MLTDTLPSGVAVISLPAGWANVARDVTGTLGIVTSGETRVFAVVVQVPSSTAAGTVLVNSAGVGSTTEDLGPAAGFAQVSTTVQTAADLAISKTAAPDPVFIGNPLTYTLVITNLGPSDALNTVVTDLLPSDVTFVSAAAGSGDCQAAGGTVTCTLGTGVAPRVASPGVFTVIIRTDVAAGTGGQITNTVRVSSDTPDPGPGNDATSISTLAVTNADLAVSKAVSAATAAAGDSLTYTLNVTNPAGVSVANVVVTDTLPAGAILISASPDCQPEAGALICRPGLMPPSTARQLTATVRVDPAAAAGLMTNTATVGSRTNNDPNLTNDIATAGTTVYRSADLAVSKSYSPEPVMQRQPVYYTVAITNAGPSLAIAARLTDTLPAELENVTVSPSQGSCGTGAVFTCALGDLAPQASARVWVSATVQAGARWLTNTVSIGSNDPDPVPGDNEFTLAATVKQADLSITKSRVR